MSTYLQLSRKLRQECEIPTGAAETPTAVTGQTGQMKRLVDWVADAWLDIQLRDVQWRWMRRAFTLNTVADDDSYAYTDATDVDAALAISRFSRWWADDVEDPFKAYLQSSGVAAQYRLIYLPWKQFKWQYRIGTQTSGQPLHVSVDHQNNLVLGPKPSAVYVVTGDFQRGPQILAADGDIPEMPTQFHNLIVYRAMEKYGANSIAAEVFARAQLECKRLMPALEMNQTMELELAEPLA